MRLSWRIVTLFGIGVRVHATFLVLLGWVVVSHLLQGHGVIDALAGLLFLLCLFSIVVLHELGHALTARRFGIRTRDITLLPIGGVARLERMPERPRHELLVALAGPMVNFVLAAGLFAAIAAWPGPAALGEVALVGGNFLVKMFWVNVSLAVFNLIPAFPMDGGRVLRALLAMRTDYARATRLAAWVGQTVAIVFGVAGLLGNPILLLIALFVWIGAAEEAALAEMNTALRDVPIRRLMITEFRSLAPDDPIERAVECVLAGFQQDFPVLADGRPVGVLTGADLLAGMARRGREARVDELMRRDFETMQPSQNAEDVLARLAGQKCRLLLVVDEGRLAGIVTPDNIAEFLAIQAALATGARTGREAKRATLARLSAPGR